MRFFMRPINLAFLDFKTEIGKLMFVPLLVNVILVEKSKIASD